MEGSSVKVLVTGAKGFIGKNLVVALRRGGVEVDEIDVDSSPDDLLAGVAGAAVVYHLAGINRPEHEEEFQTGNVGSLEAVFSAIERQVSANPGAERPLIALSSSTQAERDNPYGRTKRAAEDTLAAYCHRTSSPAAIYRLPGVFGKWCRPNYNSVVATFCHNIARDLPITVLDRANVLRLVYVDDVVKAFLGLLGSPQPAGGRFQEAEPSFIANLGEIADTLHAFRASRAKLIVPDFSDPFIKRLYATYLSYLPEGEFAYRLDKKEDPRGSLAELLKAPSFGQLFVSRTKPGITRGNHYHDTKTEKFCVLEGEALIRFRHIRGGEVSTYRVSGQEFRVVDIPPGYTHSIENVGGTEMVVLFWASEPFDSANPDTYFMEVLQ
jgi:UDP-2-acetamido-2,6-beta-L-arabino-hexul-4-ose reductase